MRKVGIRRPVLSEHIEQREYVQWFRQTYPGVRILAIPNGGARSPATAARLKVEGVCAGVPDLFVPEWGLWVEMKRETGGKVSKDQKDWLEYLDYCGYTVIVGLGKADAIKQTQQLRIEQ